MNDPVKTLNESPCPLPKLTPGSLILSGDRWFKSLQGEGIFLGCPAIFLRLHMCNLTCDWCDTRYTWDRTLPEYRSEYAVFPVRDVAEEIQRLSCTRLVITGGEPLLQQSELETLIAMLPGWDFEIETNGTILPSRTLQERCHLNVSPKLGNSGVASKLRTRIEILRELSQWPHVTFKFVVKNVEDLEELSELAEAIGVSGEKIVISPEGYDEQKMLGLARVLAQPVIEKGWRLLPRWHVLLWGNKRAV